MSQSTTQELLPQALPARIAGLADVVRTLRWSWSAEARALFWSIDYTLWHLTHHNPVRSSAKLSRRASRPAPLIRRSCGAMNPAGAIRARGRGRPNVVWWSLVSPYGGGRPSCGADYELRRGTPTSGRLGAPTPVVPQNGRKIRHQEFQTAHGEGARELVSLRLRSRDVGGDDPEEPVADEEHERGGPIHRAGTEHSAVRRQRLEFVIARPRLAPHHHRRPVPIAQHAP
jgi:hypothetical protein